jgi:D-alanyl-D-alanine carboxypeptidase
VLQTLALGILLAVLIWLLQLRRVARLYPSGCIEGAPAVVVPELQAVLDAASRDGLGLQAALIDGGGGWSGCAGLANRELGCPVRPGSLLAYASATKPFTAALVLRLAAEGRIALEEPINLALDLDAAFEGVRVGHLLGHTSGIEDYTTDLGFRLRYMLEPRRAWRAEELIDIAARGPLAFAPGSSFRYSNTNYVLLGRLAERRGGAPLAELPLAELMRERLLVPHGLRETRLLPDDLAELPMVRGYDESYLRLGLRDVTAFRRGHLHGAWAAGGLIGTAAELARFLHVLMTGGVLPEPWLARMMDVVAVRDRRLPELQGYGLGLQHLVLEGETWLGHIGTMPGFTALALHAPARGTTVAVLANRSVVRLAPLAAALLAARSGATGSGRGGASGSGRRIRPPAAPRPSGA